MKRFSFPLCSLHCFVNQKLWFCVSEEKCRSFIELSPPAERGKSKSLYLTVATQCASLGQGTCNILPVWGQQGECPKSQAWNPVLVVARRAKISSQMFTSIHKPLPFVKSVLGTSDSLQYEVWFVSCGKLPGLGLSSCCCKGEEDRCCLRAVPHTQATY